MSGFGRGGFSPRGGGGDRGGRGMASEKEREENAKRSSFAFALFRGPSFPVTAWHCIRMVTRDSILVFRDFWNLSSSRYPALVS